MNGGSSPSLLCRFAAPPETEVALPDDGCEIRLEAAETPQGDHSEDVRGLLVQVAWSPVCFTAGANAARFSILAVGTKSGRLWLWRYRMPESFSLKEARDLVDHSFSLVSS